MRLHSTPSATLGLAVAALALTGDPPAWSAVTEAGFIERQIVSGLSNPTAMAFAPDGRLFVCQQGGALRVIKNGTLLATPFVSLTVSSTGERGLLGVAFDPDFETTPFVYVYYTATTPTVHNRVSRFTAAGDVAEPGSELVLMDLETLSATNHNGGAIHFGPDGMLYVAVGENAVGSNSQTLDNRLGKMLRIHKDGTIPTDNPFYGTATGVNRSIWALGLRNPFTFAFNGDGTRMFINDVGQTTWEEINDGIAGSNYGWPAGDGPINPNPNGYRQPLYAYAHSGAAPTGCAIVGGAFHDPAKVTWPAPFVGDYFFADLCSHWIRRFDPASPGGSVEFATGQTTPVDLTTGPEGDLYALARGSGGVVRRFSTDWIFGDGLEGGDASAWSDAATDGGDLTVTMAAALGGTGQGLEANVNDTRPLFVRDDTPNDENRYRARFHFDPNGFDPGESVGRLRVRLFLAFEEWPVQRRLVTLVLRRSLGVYALSARVRLDDGTTADTPFVEIADAPHVVEFDWRRSTSPSTPNGAFTLRLDGAVVGTLSALDNDLRAVDFARLGAMAVKPGAAGTLYLDEFVSYREGPAGPLP
jgi:glucose/arabinose dehydrogenase